MLEAQRVVAAQHAGQQPGLGQDLEPVADPEHQPATLRVVAHGAHDRAEAGDRAGAQVVAVGEAAGQDDRVGATQLGRSRARAAPLRRPRAAPRATRRGRSSNPGRRRRRPSTQYLDRPLLDEWIGQEVRRQPLDDRRGRRLPISASTVELDPPPDANVMHASRPELRQGRSRLPGPADRGCRRAA